LWEEYQRLKAFEDKISKAFDDWVKPRRLADLVKYNIDINVKRLENDTSSLQASKNFRFKRLLQKHFTLLIEGENYSATFVLISKKV